MTVRFLQRPEELSGLSRSFTGRSLFPLSWILFGVLMVSALSFCYLIEESRVPWLGLTSWFLIWLAWIPLSHGISNFVAHCPIERHNWRRRVPSYFTGGALVVASLLVLRVLLDRYFHILDSSEFLGFKLRAFLVQSVVYDIFAFFGFVALGHASSYYHRLTRRQIRDAEMKARMAEIQLGFLKAQLQPHFLLNSLNLISGQLYEDVERADAMIADLGGLLRATLESPEQHEIPLARELELLELYLGIARTRFGPDLQVEKTIEPRSLDSLVPSLLLQPLVENAIRHGTSRKHGVNRVVISASRDAYNLLLRVEDDGPGLTEADTDSAREGIGLANIRRRLEQLYPSDHRFTLLNRPSGGAIATIRLPFRPAAAQKLQAKREALIDHSHTDRRRRALGA